MIKMERKTIKEVDLEKLAEGVYSIPKTKEQDSQTNPNEFSFGLYFMPSALGNFESEEVAARLLEHGQKQGKHVAVDYRRLLAEMLYDGMGGDPKLVEKIKDVAPYLKDRKLPEMTQASFLLNVQVTRNGKALSPAERINSILDRTIQEGFVEVIDIDGNAGSLFYLTDRAISSLQERGYHRKK